MCRACGQKFDTEQLSNNEWIMPKQKWYFHTKCYTDWRDNGTNVKVNDKPNEWFFEHLKEYLYQDLKMSVDFSKMTSQWNHFLKSKSPKMTAKGIYFTMRYFYDIRRGDPEKAQGGIGIVPNIYKEATEYWAKKEFEKEGTLQAILDQIEQRAARPVELVTQRKSQKKDKTRWSLDDI